jgi:hypothetical protein
LVCSGEEHQNVSATPPPSPCRPIPNNVGHFAFTVGLYKRIANAFTLIRL